MLLGWATLSAFTLGLQVMVFIPHLETRLQP